MDNIDSITLDVPLLIRLLEHAREDVKTDAQLHEVVTRVIALSKTGVEILGMEQYSQIVGKTQMAKLKALTRVQQTAAIDMKEALPFVKNVVAGLKAINAKVSSKFQANGNVVISLSCKANATPQFAALMNEAGFDARETKFGSVKKWGWVKKNDTGMTISLAYDQIGLVTLIVHKK